MVYDAAQGEIILFGGLQDDNVYLGDTWTWDGNSWALASQSGPEPRIGAAMAYDSTRNSTVLFGGLDSDSDELSDTWLWDSVQWEPVAAVGPSSRWSAPMIYAANLDAFLLHGGARNLDGRADTWQFGIAIVRGDVNCDCALDALDIEPFLVALFDPENYPVLYPECEITRADINNDGRIDALDIEPFIELLFAP